MSTPVCFDSHFGTINTRANYKLDRLAKCSRNKELSNNTPGNEIVHPHAIIFRNK